MRMLDALGSDYEVHWAQTLHSAGCLLERRSYDAVIASLGFRHGRGMDILEQALGIYPRTAAILVTEPREFEKPHLNGLEGRVVVLRRTDDTDYLRCWIEQQIHGARLRQAAAGFAKTVNQYNRRLMTRKKRKPPA